MELPVRRPTAALRREARRQAHRLVDRNRITGGGVTAGIDFGLYLASQLAGEEAARRIQSFLEYDPAPPFDSGSPRTASAAVVQGEAVGHRCWSAAGPPRAAPPRG